MTEVRSWPLEVRGVSDDGRTLTARLMRYNEVSEDTPVGPEVFEPRSLRRSIKAINASRPLKLFRAHDQTRPVGLSRSLSDDDDEVVGEFYLADTEMGREAAQEVREQVLDSMSVGFQAVRERVVGGVRSIVEARLVEASLVPLPAYESARVLSLRSAAEAALPPPVALPPRRVIILAGVRWTV